MHFCTELMIKHVKGNNNLCLHDEYKVSRFAAVLQDYVLACDTILPLTCLDSCA